MHSKYRRMLDKMVEKEKTAKHKDRKRNFWSVYILRCGDGSLYTGIAKDVELRIQKHRAGKGAKYTRTRLPIELIYQESCAGRTEALVRECQIKTYPKKKKERLVGNGRGHSTMKDKS